MRLPFEGEAVFTKEAVMRKMLLAVLALTVLGSSSCSDAWATTVDGSITVLAEDWTVANNLATNAALLTTTGLAPAGVQILKGIGVTACVSAAVGQTVTSGNMRAYIYMPVDATPTYRWMKYPALDWALTASVRDQCHGDIAVFTGIGRFGYVEDDVVLSGGTTVKVTYSMRNRM